METDKDEKLKAGIDWLTRLSTHTVVLMKVLEVVEDERQRIAEVVASHRRTSRYRPRRSAWQSRLSTGLYTGLKAFLGLCFEDIKRLAITGNVFRNSAP